MENIKLTSQKDIPQSNIDHEKSTSPQEKIQLSIKTQFSKFENLSYNSTETIPEFTHIVSDFQDILNTYKDVIHYAVNTNNTEIIKLFNQFKAAIGLPGAVENNHNIVDKFFKIFNGNKRLETGDMALLFVFLKLINKINNELESKKQAS